MRCCALVGATVTLLHFPDYHSHAVPFYSEGQANTAGIARAIAYLKQFADDPNALIFSGGNTINRGSPAWSDKYQCAEWSWLNGIVDAMAFGNHDADYGAEIFAQCRSQINCPITCVPTFWALMVSHCFNMAAKLTMSLKSTAAKLVYLPWPRQTSKT